MGATSNRTTRGWNASAGIGLNANRFLGVLVQGDYLRMPIAAAVLKAQGVPGGNVHLWSATLNPILHIYPGRIFGIYLTGGGGFYRTVTEFTRTGDYGTCTASICFVGSTNAIVAAYYSNSIGASGGIGFDWKLYPSAAAKIFAESRYVWVNNQPNSSLAYPKAAGRINAVPITFGIRW